eukprot:30899-Pelagococcus_subviridis.AAC.13
MKDPLRVAKAKNLALLHLERDVARALANRKRPPLRARVKPLHRPRAVRVRLADVQLRLVHPQVILRVRRRAEQRVQHRLARAVRHELEHDEALLVRFPADDVQDASDLVGRHVDAVEVADRLALVAGRVVRRLGRRFRGRLRREDEDDDDDDDDG